MRIELTTSSLPRKCSTTELQQLNESIVSEKLKSGRPGSNRPPSAWKADALPNELLPLLIISFKELYQISKKILFYEPLYFENAVRLHTFPADTARFR